MTKTFKQFQDYIEALCKSNKKVLHETGGRKSFFKMDEEPSNSIMGSIASPMIKIESFAGQIKDGSALMFIGHIQFLSHVSSNTNMAAAIEIAQEEAFAVMLEFWSKIYEDHQYGDKCAFMQDLFNPSFTPISAVGSKEYGWEMAFRFTVDAPEHNPANWN